MATEIQQEAQPETESPAQKGSHFSTLLWVVPTLFLLYPLSIGPVFKLVLANRLPSSVLRIYDPLRPLVNKYQPIDSFFRWYIEDVWHCR